MSNFATSTAAGGGGGGGGTGTDPLAVHKITFQGQEYVAAANSIILPTLAIPTKTSDLTNDSGFILLSDIPPIPSKTSELTNDAAFITLAQVPAAPTKTSQLTNDSGFLGATDVAPVALNGSYNSLIDKPDLSPLATAIQNASNIGGGQPLFSAKSGTNLQFKTLIAGANVTLDITTTPGAIIIGSSGGGGSSGEANTSSNLPGGVGIAAPKSGVNLPFRSLTAGAALGWEVPDANTLKITLDGTLIGIASVTTAADQIIYATGPDAFATAALTAFARSILDDANAPTVRATLGSSTIGDALFISANINAALTTLGGQTAGMIIFQQPTMDAVKTQMGFSALGKALTAAVTTSDAQIALNLVPQETVQTTTTNRLLIQGAYGLGVNAPIFTGNIDNRAVVPRGRCYCTSNTTGTRPTTFGQLITQMNDGDYAHQEWVEVTGSTGRMRRWWRDTHAAAGNVWSAWYQIAAIDQIPAVVAPGGWVTLTPYLAAGIGAFGATPQFRLNADMVDFRGGIICPAGFSGAGGLVFTLPTGYRPPYAMVNVVSIYPRSNSSDPIGTMTTSSAGDTTFNNISGGTGASTSIFLDQMRIAVNYG